MSEPLVELQEAIAEAVSSYLDDVPDAEALDADDMAENVVRALGRRRELLLAAVVARQPDDGKPANCGQSCPYCCGVVARANRLLTGGSDGLVWLGDLAGFEVVCAGARQTLRHRCGWSQLMPSEGITGDGAVYLANTVERAIKERGTHQCVRRQQ